MGLGAGDRCGKFLTSRSIREAFVQPEIEKVDEGRWCRPEEP